MVVEITVVISTVAAAIAVSIAVRSSLSSRRSRKNCFCRYGACTVYICSQASENAHSVVSW